jgi:hypothetical protein
VRELEATKRCLLQDLDYRLCQIDGDMVDRMRRRMEAHGSTTTTTPISKLRSHGKATATTGITTTTPSCGKEKARKSNLSIDLQQQIHQGTAVWMNGLQTPEPSP